VNTVGRSGPGEVPQWMSHAATCLNEAVSPELQRRCRTATSELSPQRSSGEAVAERDVRSRCSARRTHMIVRANVVQKNGQLAEIPPEIFDRLFSNLPVVSLSLKQVFYHVGDPLKYVYFVE
jgi:hypothetical protein